jgi:hypothetical protein
MSAFRNNPSLKNLDETFPDNMNSRGEQGTSVSSVRLSAVSIHFRNIVEWVFLNSVATNMNENYVSKAAEEYVDTDLQTVNLTDMAHRLLHKITSERPHLAEKRQLLVASLRKIDHR